MRANEAFLDFCSSRYRRPTVITLTCLVGLVTAWPAADEYFAQLDRQQQLEAQLASAEESASRLPALKSKAAEQALVTGNWTRRLVPSEKSHDFRETLIRLARDSGCRIRRVRMAQPRTEPMADPSEPPSQGTDKRKRKKKKAEYELHTQGITLTVSGSLPRLKKFLAGLQRTGKMLHTKRFSLGPQRRESKEIVLELDIAVFDVRRIQTEKSKRAERQGVVAS